jgi:hypothetical protein
VVGKKFLHGLWTALPARGLVRHRGSRKKTGIFQQWDERSVGGNGPGTAHGSSWEGVFFPVRLRTAEKPPKMATHSR